MPAPQTLIYTIGQTHKFRVKISEYKLTGKTKSITVTEVLSSSVLPPITAPVESDVEAAVNAARRAFSRNKGKDWAKAPGALRAKYLRAIITKVTERKSHLATLESVDCGKPLDETVWDMEDVAGCFESYVLKQPLNYPLLMAPSLAAGCTAVLKPSELPSVKLQVTTYVSRHQLIS